MRNLSVIKGLYQGNGVTRRWAIPFEYNDTAQIFVTITTFDEGDYTYRVLDRTEYTIDEDSVEIVYPKTDDDEPIPSTQYLTVWRDTDLLQLMDLTNQGAAWPDSIEASLDKLHQIVQELAEGLSRSLKVDIGDPQTPDEKLVAIQDYVLAAAESSRSASASEASAQRAAEAATISEANAAESERLAGGYADTASDAASRAEDSAISARAYNAPDYDNETTYQAGDVITYTDGNSYKALQETTGNEPPNIIYWQKVTDYVGDNFFEIDEYGYIVPMDSPSHSRYWRIDQNGYIVPIEGGDGGYRPDTRQLSAEYLNVTNEGYIKHLRADDIAAQEVDADEVTAEVAAFTTLTANAVNAQSASVTTLTADNVIAKGPVVDVRAFGAKGDGVHDDTAAIQAAIDYAIAAKKSVVFAPGKYVISDSVNIDKTGSGVVSLNLDIIGINAELYLTGSGYAAFDFAFDNAPEQNTKITVCGFTVTTDNVNRPSFIKAQYACFMTIKNCKISQVTNGIEIHYGLHCNVVNCTFWGCVKGVYYNHTRDSLIDACHAFACDYGFAADGTVDVSTDGNIAITNSVANGCVQYGIYLVGQYTPHLSDIVIETSNVGLYIYNCNYGIFSSIWIGPCTTNALLIDSSSNNQYCIFDDISLQTESVISHMIGASINNLVAYSVPAGANDCALTFSNVNYSVINNILMREINCTLAVNITGGDTLLENGKIEGNVKLHEGVYINNVYVRNVYNVVYDGNLPVKSCMNYIKYDGASNSTEKVILTGYVVSEFIQAGTTKTVDISSLLNTPSDLPQISYATFICTCGTYGSNSGAIVQAIRTSSSIKLTILNDIGNVGSGNISVNGSNINFVNTTGNLDIYCTLRIIDVGNY